MNKEHDNLEVLFQKHIEPEKISGVRTMSVLASILYSMFFIVDYFSLSSGLTDVFIIRGGVVSLMVAIFILSYTSIMEYFIKYYDFLFSIVYLIAAASIDTMIYLSLPVDHASKVYFVGLILILMTVFSWSYFKLSTSIIITVLIISSYILTDFLKDKGFVPIAVNVFFLLSGATIAFISQIIRDKVLRENFLLQQSLKHSLEEKTEEARDNEYLANHDALTGLPNRRYITLLLEQTLESAKLQDRVMVILFADLNGFKQVNDHYGHYAGDEVLKIVAQRLEMGMRKGDSLSRLGGDEYLIGLLMGKENLSEIEAIAKKFSDMVEQPMNIAGVSINISCCIGIAAFPIHGNNVEVLIDIADKKMYQAKSEQIESRNFIDNSQSIINFNRSSRKGR
ncbi:MAG: GGDEF domain-containing protein [Cocleimonas sp.]